MSARHQSRKVVEAIGGHAFLGASFHPRRAGNLFSELVRRPHDPGWSH